VVLCYIRRAFGLLLPNKKTREVVFEKKLWLSVYPMVWVLLLCIRGLMRSSEFWIGLGTRYFFFGGNMSDVTAHASLSHPLIPSSVTLFLPVSDRSEVDLRSVQCAPTPNELSLWQRANEHCPTPFPLFFLTKHLSFESSPIT
jgi:hypothetical protein